MTIENAKYQRTATALSILIHMLVLLLFYFIGFQEQDPPPQEIGMPLTIRLGFDDAGQGDTFDQASPESASESSPSSSEVAPPDVATQDVSQTVAVAETKPKPEKTEVKPIKPVEKIEEPKVDEHLNHLINKFKTQKNTGNGAQAGGGDDGKNGAQGDPNGSKDGGDIGGAFPGGKGSFRLKGRKVLSLPRVDDDSQDEGVVVVEIIVDRKGNVVKATPGAQGTTSTSPTLFKKAKEAAYKVKFTPNQEVGEEQLGSITFIFKFGS